MLRHTLRHLALPLNRRAIIATRTSFRGLHVSAPRRAAEDQASFIAGLKNTPLFRQLADKPDALAAIANLVKLMQEKGVDMQSRSPPSTMTMFRLGADPEFREAAKNLMAELQKAGVDLNSKETMDAIMKIKEGKP